jgi:hypothetical protein
MKKKAPKTTKQTEPVHFEMPMTFREHRGVLHENYNDLKKALRMMVSYDADRAPFVGTIADRLQRLECSPEILKHRREMRQRQLQELQSALAAARVTFEAVANVINGHIELFGYARDRQVQLLTYEQHELGQTISNTDREMAGYVERIDAHTKAVNFLLEGGRI